MDIRWLSRSLRFLRFPIFRRILAGVGFFALYSWLTMQYEIWLLGENIEFPSGVNTLLGISLSVLMVFRNNSSYDRWWEGRKLWGQLVNRSRSLAALVWNVESVPVTERRQFLRDVSRFSFLLRDHLRGPWPAPDNHPQRLLMGLQGQLAGWERSGLVSTHLFLSIERNVSELYDVLGGCERIRGTPLPLSHRAIVPQAMICYLLALPWGMPHGRISVMVMALVSYFLISLEMIAEELEEPFGQDPDDLPLTRTCQVIEKSIERIERLSSPADWPQDSSNGDPARRDPE